MATTIDTPEKGKGLLQRFHAWKLSDAKARFSELVREASLEPQRITVEGKDSVMIISVEMFSRLLPATAQPNLYELLSQSPLAELDFDFEAERSPVRDVEL
jgi:prevent-host-death family protein